MRWNIAFSVLLILLNLGLGNLQAQEKPKDSEAKKAKTTASSACRPKEMVSITTISEQMAEAWCTKLGQCSPDAEMSSKECLRVLKKSFQEGFQKTPSGQKVEVDEAGLCQCSESIIKNSCDALKTAQTLPGCDFIRLLNRN